MISGLIFLLGYFVLGWVERVLFFFRGLKLSDKIIFYLVLYLHVTAISLRPNQEDQTVLVGSFVGGIICL